MSELKPCGGCGHTEAVIYGAVPYDIFIGCPDCGWSTKLHKSEIETIHDWNACYYEAEGEKLKAENERLRKWVEDLQSGMYVNCVYCGHRYGPEDEVQTSMAEALKEHIEQCPEHPMSALKAEVDKYRAELARYYERDSEAQSYMGYQRENPYLGKSSVCPPRPKGAQRDTPKRD